MPDSITIHLFKLGSFNSVEDIEQHLDILHASSKYMPTHWAKDERPSSKRAYVKDEVLFYGEDIGNYGLVHLYRQPPPTYTLYYESNKRFAPSVFRLKFEDTRSFDPNIIKEIFDVSSAFACQLKPIFGYVLTSWDGDYKKYLPKQTIRAFELAKYGPNPVQARTWFEPYLIRLIGREQLAQCGAFIRDTEWEGIQLDLVPEPWNATLDELVNRQREVMECLQPTEVFGDYSSSPIFYPGKKWVHWES